MKMKKYSVHLLGVLLIFFFVYPGIEIKASQGAESRVLESIDVDKAAELIEKNKDNPDFTILDVRTLSEYQSGHLENAINIDFYSDSFREELEKLDRTRTYLIYCRSGARSLKTLKLMEELGFNEVYDMIGGIIGWEQKGYKRSYFTKAL